MKKNVVLGICGMSVDVEEADQILYLNFHTYLDEPGQTIISINIPKKKDVKALAKAIKKIADEFED
jgi:hypothetical protein